MSVLLRKQSIGLAALALGISVFLSRLLGLLRDKVVSYYFGIGAEADVYFTAFVIPDFLNYLLAGGYFSITLVPLLAQSFYENEEDAWRFFSAAVCWSVLLISVFCLIAWVFAPELGHLVAPGFSKEKHEILVRYLRIILPAQIFFLPGACFTAVLYYRRQFFIPALTPILYNIFIILGGVIGVYFFPQSGMEGFCWGVLLGAFLGSLVLPCMAVKAGGLHFFPQFIHLRMKRVLLLALPLMVGQSIVTLDEQFVRIFGSLVGEGGVSLLSYARRIMMVPVGVIAQAAGLASFPFLAALVAEKNQQGLDTHLQRTLSNALILAIPVSLWFMLAAEPVMRLIFQQGAFDGEAARQSGLLLTVMMAFVAFWTIQQIIGRGFYAFQDTLTPAILGTLATGASVGGYYFGARYFGAFGVALAGGAGVALYAFLLCFVWCRRYGSGAFKGVLPLLLWCLGLCLPAAGCGYMAGAYAASWCASGTLWQAFVFIASSGCFFGVVYLALAFVLKKELLHPFLSFFYKKRTH